MNDIQTAAGQVRSLADIAWLEIREQILTGQLPPGHPIGLKEQSERLGMSMMPIRDAVRRLQYEGLIVRVPQCEAHVAPLSLEDMEDVYGVRMAIEERAIGCAAARFTQAHHDALSALLDDFEEAYRIGHMRLGRELHRRFHLELYAVAASATLNRLIPPLIDTTERYRTLSQGLRGSVGQRREEHQGMLDACLSGDVERSRLLLREHLERTVKDVRQALELMNEQDLGKSPIA